MWSNFENTDMIGAGGAGANNMGGNKRRSGTNACALPPSKNARWEDSIARLEAVAASPGVGWDECAHACRRRWGWGSPHAHETIRAENGKSYLELAAACCDGRTCASRRCYRERRLKMMNLCAYKLARFRQTPDPSLHRSVLVCNMLRGMERELEREAAEEARQQPPPPPPPPAPLMQVPVDEWRPVPDCDGGRVTPYSQPDSDSGYGDDECTRPINWGSVLSLSNQSALDPLNNNSGHHWDVADEWPWREDRDDNDSFVQLLVGTS